MLLTGWNVIERSPVIRILAEVNSKQSNSKDLLEKEHVRLRLMDLIMFPSKTLYAPRLVSTISLCV